MPTYEYECEACGHTFEKFQSIKAKPLKTCPSCGKRKVRRLLGTGGALIFKGSGFYATDYRSPSYQRDAKKAEGGEAKGDGKGGEAKGDKTSGGEACAKNTSAACGGCRKKTGTCPNGS
ncbi:MAG: zinc ribbon domain-containing protein [Phycisphaerae bacterium]